MFLRIERKKRKKTHLMLRPKIEALNNIINKIVEYSIIDDNILQCQRIT